MVLAFVSTIMNPFLRIRLTPNTNAGTDEEPSMEPLSVIILVSDGIEFLERNLPLFLNQEYPAGFQIIIVANERDSQADDLIKKYQNYKNIKYTFIPSTARYISREKLGMTLGIKAADNEWCILTDAMCFPQSSMWLKEMGRACTTDKNIVIGYCNYDNKSKSFQRFHRLRRFAYLWNESNKRKPYTSNGSNLAIRKSDFISGDGYRGNLDIIRGEFDFLVNKYAKRRGTAIVTSPEGRLVEKAPTKKQWHRHETFYLHSCRFMNRGFRHNFMPVLDTTFMHLAWTVMLAGGIYSAITLNWVVAGASILSLITLTAGRIIIDRKAIRFFNAKVPAWRIILLEMSSVWNTLGNKIRYRKASKYDFTCHKL